MEPGVLYGPDELIISRIGEMIKKMKVAKKYIINLAHGLTPDHKPEKVGLFVKES